jgi:hypothetical protein
MHPCAAARHKPGAVGRRTLFGFSQIKRCSDTKSPRHYTNVAKAAYSTLSYLTGYQQAYF